MPNLKVVKQDIIYRDFDAVGWSLVSLETRMKACGVTQVT